MKIYSWNMKQNQSSKTDPNNRTEGEAKLTKRNPIWCEIIKNFKKSKKKRRPLIILSNLPLFKRTTEIGYFNLYVGILVICVYIFVHPPTPLPQQCVREQCKISLWLQIAIFNFHRSSQLIDQDFAYFADQFIRDY